MGARWAAVAIAVAVLLAACGGGGDGGGDGAESADQTAIEELVQDFVTAFEARDADTLVSLFSSDCPRARRELEAAFQELDAAGVDTEIELRGVEVRSIEGDSASVRVQSALIVDGEEESTDRITTQMVREDGEWKIADCNFSPGPD